MTDTTLGALEKNLDLPISLLDKGFEVVRHIAAKRKRHFNNTIFASYLQLNCKWSYSHVENSVYSLPYDQIYLYVYESDHA